MKKILLASLVFAGATLLTGCGSDHTPERAFSDCRYAIKQKIEPLNVHPVFADFATSIVRADGDGAYTVTSRFEADNEYGGRGTVVFQCSCMEASEGYDVTIKSAVAQ